MNRTTDAATRETRRVHASLRDARLEDFHVVLLPEFTLDHLMHFDTLEDAAALLEAARGGGNVDVHPDRQQLRVGGGAANTAHALARLGVRVHLIARTDPVGKRFLEEHVAPDGVDVTRVREDGALDVTGAIESRDVSIMLDTPRPGRPFGPEDLADADRALVRDADAVFVGDWVNPRARALADAVWALAHEHGARTYADAGAPHLEGAERERVLDALAAPHLDALSANAAEAHKYAPDADDLTTAGRIFSERVRARVDLHSNALTASFRDGAHVATAARFAVDARQATGAGDTWNAGSILGDLLGLADGERLLLANALAALFVRSEDAAPAERDTLLEFLATTEPEAPTEAARSPKG